MTVTIGRRELLVALGGAAVAWPLAARAQSVMPVIGFLRPSTRESAVHLLAAFRAGLKEIGFVEGQNVRSNIAGRSARKIDYAKSRQNLCAGRWPS